MTQVTTIPAAKQSLITSMASQYGMEPKAFADTVKATCMPNTASNEEFAAFLMVAKEYGLNPITREIYAFPKKGGGVQPIVGVDGWFNLINSHPQCDGIDFEDEFDDKRNLIAVKCSIYRKDRNRPTVVTEYMDECKRPTEPWQKWPKRMLRHKAAIQCARYAFGFAGIIDPDEAERSPEVITHTVIMAPPPTMSTDHESPTVPFDSTAFLTELEEALTVAGDIETLEDIWSSHDPLSVLEGDDHAQDVALKIKERCLAAIDTGAAA